MKVYEKYSAVVYILFLRALPREFVCAILNYSTRYRKRALGNGGSFRLRPIKTRKAGNDSGLSQLEGIGR